MHSFDEIKEYTETVCRQIRWKKAHSGIARELENHLADQRDAYLREGADEATATSRAIAQMGDPVEVGMQLDRTHRPKPQWAMLLLTLLLVCAGLALRLMLVQQGFSFGGAKQVLATAVGVAVLFAAYFCDFTLLGRYAKAFYWAVVVCIALPMFFIGMSGSSWMSWHHIFAIAPIVFPLAFSVVVYAQRGKGYAGILLCGVAVLPLLWASLMLPSFPGVFLLVGCGLAVLCAAIARGWFGVNKVKGQLLVFLPTLGVLSFIIWDLHTWSYAVHRWQTILNPMADPEGAGYVAVLTRRLLDNAVLWGQGTLPVQYASLKRFPLPEVATDSMLTYLIFQMGWLVFWVLMAAFAVFMVKGIIACLRQKSELGFLVSLTVLLVLGSQLAGYVVYNLGFQPMSSLSLPLISYGDTALLLNLALIGLMLSVFRNGQVASDAEQLQSKSAPSFIRYHDKKLTVDFSRLDKLNLLEKLDKWNLLHKA